MPNILGVLVPGKPSAPVPVPSHTVVQHLRAQAVGDEERAICQPVGFTSRRPGQKSRYVPKWNTSLPSSHCNSLAQSLCNTHPRSLHGPAPRERLAVQSSYLSSHPIPLFVQFPPERARTLAPTTETPYVPLPPLQHNHPMFHTILPYFHRTLFRTRASASTKADEANDNEDSEDARSFQHHWVLADA